MYWVSDECPFYFGSVVFRVVVSSDLCGCVPIRAQYPLALCWLTCMLLW
jgi:hypothetical protein